MKLNLNGFSPFTSINNSDTICARLIFFYLGTTEFIKTAVPWITFYLGDDFMNIGAISQSTSTSQTSSSSEKLNTLQKKLEELQNSLSETQSKYSSALAEGDKETADALQAEITTTQNSITTVQNSIRKIQNSQSQGGTSSVKNTATVEALEKLEEAQNEEKVEAEKEKNFDTFEKSNDDLLKGSGTYKLVTENGLTSVLVDSLEEE